MGKRRVLPGPEPARWSDTCSTRRARGADPLSLGVEPPTGSPGRCSVDRPLRSSVGRSGSRACPCGRTSVRPGSPCRPRQPSSPATAIGLTPLLADRLVRLQHSTSGEFEDRASQAVVDRAFPPAEFDVTETDDRLSPHRPAQLVYDKQPFTTEGLSVQVTGRFRSGDRVWRFGPPTDNLGGTARTLDDADGAVPLEPGVLRPRARRVDDSAHRPAHRRRRIAPRRPGTQDLYVSPTATTTAPRCAALYALTGPRRCCRAGRSATGGAATTPTPPTSTSRCWTLSRAAGVPLSVAVLDMDWHLVDIDPRSAPAGPATPGTATSSPTRRRSSPSCTSAASPPRSTCTRPRACTPTRTATRPSRSAMGIDPAGELPVDFDPTDPEFLEAYFEELHHPLEDEGVDFWWLDWQQGGVTRSPGSTRCGCSTTSTSSTPARDGRRPLTFSRYAGWAATATRRLLRRHRHHLGVAGLPALLHRDRVQRRLRLVEPRHRRPLLRLKDDELGSAGSSSACSPRSSGCTR